MSAEKPKGRMSNSELRKKAIDTLTKVRLTGSERKPAIISDAHERNAQSLATSRVIAPV
jgi:hypothetical protein